MRARILVVDDDRELCKEIEELLEGEGYEVQAVHDGLAGLDEIERGDHDLILLDLRMPGLTGVEVLERMSPESGRSARVLIMSGSPPLGSAFKGGEFPSQVSGVLVKPFDAGAALERIRSLLASATP